MFCGCSGNLVAIILSRSVSEGQSGRNPPVTKLFTLLVSEDPCNPKKRQNVLTEKVVENAVFLGQEIQLDTECAYLYQHSGLIVMFLKGSDLHCHLREVCPIPSVRFTWKARKIKKTYYSS